YVIVVGANDDGFFRSRGIAPRQHANHVPDGAAILREVLDVIDSTVRQIARSGLEIAVDLTRDGVELPRIDQRLRVLTTDSQHRDAVVLGIRIAAKQTVRRIVYAVGGVADDEEELRSLVARDRRLRSKSGLRHRADAVQATVGVPLLRLVTENQDGLAADG